MGDLRLNFLSAPTPRLSQENFGGMQDVQSYFHSFPFELHIAMAVAPAFLAYFSILL